MENKIEIDVFYSTICSRLRIYREIKGYTQQKVADLLSVARSTYVFWEMGKVRPDTFYLHLLAEIYEIDVDIFWL